MKIHVLGLIIIKLMGVCFFGAGIWLVVVMTQLYISSNTKLEALLWYLPGSGFGVGLLGAGFGLLTARSVQDVAHRLINLTCLDGK